MLTLKQYQAQEYWTLRREYPDATPDECSELATSLCRRSQWVQQITEDMKAGTPTKRQWRRILAELGPEYISRRVFHDAPDSCARYVEAGLFLPSI